MNILMLTDSNFPMDVRIRQEAYKLSNHGHRVSVIAIKDKGQPFFETLKGVQVYRIPKIELFKKGKQSKSKDGQFFHKILILVKGILGYGFEYFYFTVACFFLSFLVLLKDRFDVIHTHNPPDTLFTVASFYKMFGKKFVYDHHDLSPDLFLEKYSSRGRFMYRFLAYLEKLSCQSADLIIATNESYKKIEIERCGVKPENIYVVRNGPDLNEMKITEHIEAIRSKAKTILCYLGAINIQDGVDYLLDTLAKIVFDHNYRDVCLIIVGDGDYLYRIKELAKELDLNEYIVFTGYISERNELSRYLSTADMFVDAAPYSFLNDNSTFIKHMEYMIYGKPVISFALKESMFSLKDAGVFVKPNDTGEMARVILGLIQDEKRKRDLGIKARERVKELSWDKVSIPLIQVYETLKLSRHSG
jgi:glycosyltransferase involved in cell wall biosynthesis